MSRNSFYGLALLIVILDQITKARVIATLPLGASTPLIPGVFHLSHTQNRGMAFSLLQGATLLLAGAALIVIAVIVRSAHNAGPRLPLLYGLALALPLGGALGNLIDRLRLGYVTDFLDFRLINFPVFNVADSAITIGIVLLAWRTLMAPPAPSPLAPPLVGAGGASEGNAP